MKHFYIGLSRSKNNKVGSVLLQKYMNRPYSHTFFEYDTMRGVQDNTIFHSSMSSGVGYWSNYTFEKKNTKTHLYRVEVSDEVFKALRTKVHRHAGNHYAFLQNIGILLVDICQNMGFDVQNPFREHENCSELVYLALVELHPELALQYKQNTISPVDIEDIMIAYGYENVISNS